MTDILNAVAPPISEHEVIQVWLSHDMQGYEGVETLVYRGLARVSYALIAWLLPLRLFAARFWNKWMGETWL